MFVERHLDGAVQLAFVKGFEDVPERLREFRALECALVGMRGQKNHWHIGARAVT